MTKEEIIASIRKDGYLWIPDASKIYDILMEYPEKGRLLEIGTGSGDSTNFWALTKPKWNIYTVDSYGTASNYIQGAAFNDFQRMIGVWKMRQMRNIIPIVADSHYLPWEIDIDVLYIDGDHAYDSVKADFERYSPFVKKGGFIAMDDYTLDDKDIKVGKYLENEVKPNPNFRIELLERLALVWPTK